MADDDPYSTPYDSGTGTVIAPPLAANNPTLAREFLEHHRGQFQRREGQVVGVENQQQANIDRMSKVLEETAAAIKAARSGRVNLPLMAFGAGMLSTPGNFGSQLGGGFRAAVPTIQADREADDKTNLNLANLAATRAGLENAPLKDRLAYIRALQTGDLAAMRTIEAALIRGQTTDANRQQQQVSKALGTALDTARKLYTAENKEMYSTAEEAEARINELTRQQIEIQRAAGIDIPQAVVDRVLKTNAPGGQGPAAAPQRRQAKGFYPKTNEEGAALGLPNRPAAYSYDMIGPGKQTADKFQEESKKWGKLTEDWKTSNEDAARTDAGLDEITRILDRNPKVVGRQKALPNNIIPNFSEDSQRLQALFNSINLSNVPKGQGAVSNYERELFSSANANMNMEAQANKDHIAMMRRVLERRKDYRSYLEGYFTAYGTIDGADEAWDRYVKSPVGSMVVRDKAGKFIPNPSHQTWREFFQSERNPVPKQEGGPVRLDYDD